MSLRGTEEELKRNLRLESRILKVKGYGMFDRESSEADLVQTEVPMYIFRG